MAILVVALLIYKVPTHVMLQPQASVTPAESEMALQAKRVRDATRILIQYSSEPQKNPVMFLDALEKVEAILTGRAVDVSKATDNSSSPSLVRTAESPGEVKANKQVVGPLQVPPDEVKE